jgi:hypothetical protein
MILVELDPEFPLDDVEVIGARLTASGALAPGYIPPDAGMLSIPALYFAQDIEKNEIVLLPDRNLASIAADLMAFAQAMNLQIEPSIAFHELAHQKGNAVALDELSWFSAADHGQARAWIDLAQGRIDRLPIVAPEPLADRDLACPLHRWCRNYVVALKIAELELADATPLERALMLFQWMVDDYFMAGPAAIFATLYFAPFAEKRRLMKQLRSPDRERAIAGIKNAAWDITHLSDFVLRAKRSETKSIRCIFATADRGLAKIAPVLMIGAEENRHVSELAQSLSAWWPAADAAKVAETLSDHIQKIRGRDAPAFGLSSNDPIQALINAGEGLIRAWSSTPAS